MSRVCRVTKSNSSLHYCTLLSIVGFLMTSTLLFCYVISTHPMQPNDILDLIAMKEDYLKSDFYQSEWKDYRLGNVIDRWFTTPLVRNEWSSHPNSFASYLNQHPPHITVHGLMNTSKVICHQSRNSVRRLLFPRHIQYFTYDIDLIRQALPVFSPQLENAINNYYGPGVVRKALKLGKGVCFIHYRIGDFVSAGVYISPDSVVAAVESFPTRPNRIVWMDSGKNFTTKIVLRGQIAAGERIKSAILDKLGELDYDVTVGTNGFPRLAANSVDSDFLLGSSGEYLVTGFGSFAITMAAASKQHVRIPAVDMYNPNDCTPRPVQHIRLMTRDEYSFETYDVDMKKF